MPHSNGMHVQVPGKHVPGGLPEVGMTTAAVRPGRFADVWKLPGVYAPQADTCLLAQALHDEGVSAGADVLDVCTGSGALAVVAARMGARVSATDISRRAV